MKTEDIIGLLILTPIIVMLWTAAAWFLFKVF